MTTKTPFIIYAESTPNPQVMKFVSNKMLSQISKEFFHIDETTEWPLINKVFSFPFVQEVFISSNYISIKKHTQIDWKDVTNQLRIFIQEQLNLNVAISIKKHVQNEQQKQKTKIDLEVEELINTRIRPGIQMDGGDIELISTQDGIVKVFLKGACSGCPSSQMTLKNGIEVLLKEKMPGKIKEVIAINT